jgi:hypothetical protein
MLLGYGDVTLQSAVHIGHGKTLLCSLLRFPVNSKQRERWIQRRTCRYLIGQFNKCLKHCKRVNRRGVLET